MMEKVYKMLKENYLNYCQIAGLMEIWKAFMYFYKLDIILH